MNALIPADDMAQLVSSLPLPEIEELRAWCEIVVAFDAAEPRQRSAVATALISTYAGRVHGGLSLKTIYRKSANFRAQGWRGLMRIKGQVSTSAIRANEALLHHWQALVMSNQRASAPAFRALISELRSGQEIPGIGTWQTLFRTEYPGREVPKLCPYKVGILLPRGWSAANLNRFKPSKWALTASRTGTLAAANLLPQVRRTRAGLKRGQIVEIDDMWHDVKVMYRSNLKAERCIELAMLDVATGYRSYMLKPIRRREDGSRELIMGRMMPYVIGHWLIVQGYCPEGAMIAGEHATAAASHALQAAVEAATGGKVRFAAGGLLSKPLAAGLYDGRPRGNFRFKARLEGGHALLHNELGNIQGQVGYTRDNAPETLYAMDKLESQLMRAADAIAKQGDKGIYDRLRWPFIPYVDYSLLVSSAVTAINERTEHALEGWQEQGFMTGAFRLTKDAPWQDASELDNYPTAVANAIRTSLADHPDLWRLRKLSPVEAWKKRESDVIRADRACMPLILGERLAMKSKCSDRLELKVRDPDIDLSETVIGVVTRPDGTNFNLTRGTSYQVWINPLEPLIAYIADERSQYLGTAKVQIAGHQDDTQSIQQALGVRASAQANERAAILPALHHQIETKHTMDAINQAVLANARTSYKPLVPSHKPVKCTFSLDDLI